MEATQGEPIFVGFGPNPLSPHDGRPLHRVTAAGASRLRQAVRDECPKVPGVYGMLNRTGHLIYVGKSKRLRTRLLSYFSPKNEQEKAGRIIKRTATIVWETQPSEFGALLREQQLIRRWTPRWNVQEIPKRQQPVYLCLGRSPAPYFFLDKLPPEDVVSSIGPFLGKARMTRSVDSLNDFFRLRDCSNKQPLYFADQMQLFDVEYRAGCLRYEIGNCSGACVCKCSRAEYDSQVSAAQSFLDGYNARPIESVRETMHAAAQARQYELASRMRDDLKSLEYLARKIDFLADARSKYTFIYSVPGFDGCGVWYLIRQGEVSEAIRAPTSPADYAQTRREIATWKRAIADPKNHNAASKYPHTLSLVARWLKKNPEELQRTFQPGEAGRKYRRLAKVS